MKKYLHLFIMTIFLAIPFLNLSANDLINDPSSITHDLLLPDEIGVPEENRESEAEAESNHFYKAFFSMLSTLGIIIIFIVVITWLLKKFLNTRIQQVNNMSMIKIVESRTLTPKTTIYLIRVSGKEFLIADGHNGVTRLAEFTPENSTSDLNSQIH